jgi:phosphoglucosamine mutase
VSRLVGSEMCIRDRACTVMSNLGLHEALRQAGIAVLTTAVGDRHVIEALRAGGFSFGGENSGHLIFADHATTGDGILSALQVLRIMKRTGRPLSVLAQVMREYPQTLVNLMVRAKPPLESLPALQAALREADAAFGPLGRHLIRYSGTENKVRILVEHREAAVVDAWSTRLRVIIEQELA